LIRPDTAEGGRMKELRDKDEIAKLLKVSLPILEAYLKNKKGVIINGRVDKKRLYEYINKESLFGLSGKG